MQGIHFNSLFPVIIMLRNSSDACSKLVTVAFQVQLQDGSSLVQWFLCLEQVLFIQIIPISWTGLFTASYNIWRLGKGIIINKQNL